MSKLKLSTIFEVENIKTAEDARQVMMFLSQLLNEAVQLEQELKKVIEANKLGARNEQKRDNNYKCSNC